ncbi:MAG: LPS export ABC transporter periplasmic protein LptC [Acidobacteria bacterium]|nr:LPS export ABC transporter periplasmic protein LptC [Acidobacteriota bacterium]
MSPRLLLHARRFLTGLILAVVLALVWNAAHSWIAKVRTAGDLPGKLGSQLRRAAEGIEYSDHRDGVQRLRIRAERLVETRAGVHLLQGIEAGDFDAAGGARHSIRSRQARYDAKGGTVDFSGEVRLRLGQELRLETRSLHYDINGETASTPDRIAIESGEAAGSALGARYDRARETIELLEEVRLRVGAAGENFRASADRATVAVGRDLILFEGGAAIESERSGALEGERIVLGLGPGRRVESLAAEGGASALLADGQGVRELEGGRIEFAVAGGERLERVRVTGGGALRSSSAGRQERLGGEEIDLDLDPAGAPREMRARGGVRFLMTPGGGDGTEVSGQSVRAVFGEGAALKRVEVDGAALLTFSGSPGERHTLEAHSVRLDFAGARAVPRQLRAEGSVRWRLQPAAGGGAERTLQAERLEIEFAEAGGRPLSAEARGGVRVSELEAGSPLARTLSSARMRFTFFPASGHPRGVEAEGGVRTLYETGAPDGGARERFETASERMSVRFAEREGKSVVEHAVQEGDFAYRDAAYSASAERCDYEAAGDTLTLLGGVRVVEASSVTTGARATYGRREKVLRLTGGVRSVLSGGTGELLGGLGRSPVVITAPGLELRGADRGEPGAVRYEGGVRVLGESQQLEARTLEIAAGEGKLEASGGVLHRIFPGPEGKGAPGRGAVIRSEGVDYERHLVTYSGGVRLESEEVRLEAREIDVWIDPEKKDIRRAEARVGVRIAHLGREGRGDSAEWLPGEGRFVIVGRPAVIDDPERGRSHARRLTYFQADDRILLGE